MSEQANRWRKRQSIAGQVARMKSEVEELREDNKILFEDCEQLRRERDEWKQRRDLAIQRAEKADLEVERLRRELQNIANAKRYDYQPDDFGFWVQNRARHAIGQKAGEPTIKKS